MDKVLVIGSNSFSGSSFSSFLLEQGVEVHGVSRSLQPITAMRPYLWGKNSNQFSWVRKNVRNNEIEISLKKNFTNNKKGNRVLVGSFIFKNYKILDKSIKYITKNNLKIKNEYYLDKAVSISKKIGFKLGEIIVKKYKSWGSHTELKNFK